MLDLLSRGLAAYGLNPEAASTLAEYTRLLLEGSTSLNLTAIRDPEEAATRHMLDCAGVLGAGEFPGKRLLDVGSGAGFPGLVLKICCPDLEVTLLDSLQKRVDWLEETCRALHVSAVCVHGRAEELARQPEYRAQYDLVTARAVADLRQLCELCLPFLKVGGVFLAMKSNHCDEEVDRAASAIALLGGSLMEFFPYTVPGTDLNRRVIRIQKIKPTEERYPRRFARIQKDPL